MPWRHSTATRAARIARAVAHQVNEQLPERDQLADLTRRSTDRLVPSSRRAARRRRRWRWRSLARIVGLVAAGLLAGWLAVANRGAPAWRAVEGQLGRAGGWLPRARSGMSTPAAPTSAQAAPADAEVAQLRQATGDADGKPATLTQSATHSRRTRPACAAHHHHHHHHHHPPARCRRIGASLAERVGAETVAWRVSCGSACWFRYRAPVPAAVTEAILCAVQTRLPNAVPLLKGA